VWVLSPLVETDDPEIAWYADFSQSQAEYDRAFAALGHAWQWQPVTLRDYATSSRAIAARVERTRAGRAQPL
jgi:D-alanine-D-alanine ligase